MARHPQDDLFEGTKMTFGEHIEELRTALFQAIIGLSIGVAIGFYIASTVVQWIQTPLKKALDEYYLDKAVDDVVGSYHGALPFEEVTAVRELKLAPELMKVDPHHLLETLQSSDTEAGLGQYNPHQITARDLKSDDAEDFDNLKDFVDFWVAEGQRDRSTPERRLWTLLSAQQRRTLTSLSQKNALSAADVRTVAGILNSLVDKPAMHQAPELRGVKGVDKYMQQTLDDLREQAQVELSANESRRINRLLMTAVFPAYVNNPRVQLVDVPYWRPIDTKVQSLGAQEAFMIWMKAAFIAGMVISAPWVFWKIWDFVAAGLYPHEKHYVYLYLPFSLGLFFAGAALAFFFVFEPVLGFLFSFNKAMNIDPDPRISEWLSFVLFLPLGFGISFQLPLVMLFLQRIGLVTVETYVSKWRIAILVIFVIAMVLTPADPISMLLMACPLTVLYFGGIGLCLWMPRSRNPYRELQAYEP